MDVWCALWFWPLDKVDELPDRSQWERQRIAPKFGTSAVVDPLLFPVVDARRAALDRLGPDHNFVVGLGSLGIKRIRNLKGGMAADGSVENTGAEGLKPVQGAFFQTVSAASTGHGGQLFALKDQPRKAPRLFSETSIETLVETYPWLKTARAIAEWQRFVHFDLIFADVMRERGGFDLVIGNPPWMKPEWNDAVGRGIDSSNPSPSSGESGTNRFLR